MNNGILLVEDNRFFGTDLLTDAAFTFQKIPAVLFVNRVIQRDGLGVGDIGGTPMVQIQIKRIRYFHRTLLCAYTASDTRFRIHCPGFFL